MGWDQVEVCVRLCRRWWSVASSPGAPCSMLRSGLPEAEPAGGWRNCIARPARRATMLWLSAASTCHSPASTSYPNHAHSARAISVPDPGRACCEPGRGWRTLARARNMGGKAHQGLQPTTPNTDHTTEGALPPLPIPPSTSSAAAATQVRCPSTTTAALTRKGAAHWWVRLLDPLPPLFRTVKCQPSIGIESRRQQCIFKADNMRA